MIFREAYPLVADRSTDLDFDLINEPSLTMQQFKADCQVENILKKYKKMGTTAEQQAYMADSQAIFGDFIDIPDFQEARNKIIEAEAVFAAIPATLRNRFNNDPGEYLDFVTDPRNLEELRSLGLAKPAPVEVPNGA